VLLKVILILFLVSAVSVGVVLVSGKAALFVIPKAANIGAQTGETCDKTDPECAKGLRGVWKGNKCTCYPPPDGFCNGDPDGSMGCSGNKVVRCENNSSVTVQDCSKTGDTCDVKNGAFYCRRWGTNPSPKSTPPPKKESGCGSTNYPACNSGTCDLGYKCQKINSSCGCVKNSKK
jgi:hypothetical protein